MTGLLPTWGQRQCQLRHSQQQYAPLPLGNQFRAQKATPPPPTTTISTTTTAGTRPTPTLGYDYQGQGTCLQLTEDGSWPYPI